MAERILLVDDEEGIRKMLGLILRDAGYAVLTASGGEEALAIFARERPRIVLTDIKMPGMDGIAVLGRIKDISPDTEVIMVTGHGDVDLAIQSIKHQATDFVTKPVNEEILKIALSRATERIAMRRQIREHTENLERLVEEKTRDLLAAERFAAVGRTAAGLSHAIKNIASGLEGAIFVIEEGRAACRPESLNQGWEMLKASVQRIKNLSMELLRLSGRTMLCIGAHDPDRTAREVVEFMAASAKERGIALSLQCGAEEGPYLFDAEAMHRCLLNLVTNALDACAESERGPRRVALATSLEDGFVWFSVADNGPGMSEAIRRRIFTEPVSTKGSRGTGFGLLSAKQIAEAHGGSIEIFSTPGGGAVFVVGIPARRPR